MEYLSEHPENEYWWQARNEDGETGYVPASYVLIKEEKVCYDSMALSLSPLPLSHLPSSPPSNFSLPSSLPPSPPLYVIGKKKKSKIYLYFLLTMQLLPWLEQSVLEEREKERKERLHRQNLQQAFSEGKGFGPAPKNLKSSQPYVYVSAYNRFSNIIL